MIGALLKTLRLLRTLVFWGLLICLAGLNVATLTSQAIFNGLSAAVEMLVPEASVRAKVVGESARFRREAEAARVDRDRARAERRRASAALDRSRARGAAAEKRLARAEEVIERQRAAARRLSRKIVPRMGGNLRRNVISMPLEALPYVGWRVIAGVTALEIGDACATIEDMAMLEADFGLASAGSVEGKSYCGVTKDQLLRSIWRGDSQESCEMLRESGAELEECAPNRPLPPPSATVNTARRTLPDPPPPPELSPPKQTRALEAPEPPAKP